MGNTLKGEYRDVHTSQLIKAEPFLNEYFGIGFGYFEQEISMLNGYNLNTDIPALEALKLNEYIPLWFSFEPKDLYELVNIIEEDDDNDGLIVLTLVFLSYVIMEQDWSWEYENQDFIDYANYHNVREDLLKLYIFKQQHPKSRRSQKITLKHSLGNVEIKNYDNWFISNLLNDYLAKYLADVTSTEQAEKELLIYKKSAGRKPKDPRLHIVMYGIFRMFNTEKNMKSPLSDSLCVLIISYLQFVGILEEDTHIDNQWIRSQVNYLKSKKSPPRFPERVLMKKCSNEELKKSGGRLY